MIDLKFHNKFYFSQVMYNTTYILLILVCVCVHMYMYMYDSFAYRLW